MRLGISRPDTDSSARLSEDLTDVGGSIREEISRIGVLPLPNSVHDSATVRMDQPAQEFLRFVGSDLRLPRREPDAALMLPPRTMLREHARPMPPVGIDLDASLVINRSNAIDFAIPNRRHRPADLLDRVPVSGVLHDAELVRPWMPCDRSVTQVHPEEECVSAFIQSTSVASRA